MLANFIEDVKKELDKKRAIYVKKMTSGQATDFAQYKFWVGMVEGIDLSLAIIRKTVEKLDED